MSGLTRPSRPEKPRKSFLILPGLIVIALLAATPAPIDAGSIATDVRLDGALSLEGSPDLLDPWVFLPATFDFLLSRDSTEVVAYVRNSDVMAHADVGVRVLSSPNPDLQFLQDESALGDLNPGQWGAARFVVRSDSIPAGLYRIPLEISSQDLIWPDTLELATAMFLPDTVVDAAGTRIVTLGMQAPDGDYGVAEVFSDDPFPPAPDCPIEFPALRQVTISYRPCEPYQGVHPPAVCESRVFPPLPPLAFRQQETNWVKKITAGVASALGLAEYEAKELLGGSILKFLKEKGWKWVLKKAVTRALGWWMAAFAICAGIANAILVDPPEGDFFYVGEQNTPPPPNEFTLEELVEIQIDDIQGSCDANIRVVGTRTFHRITDQNQYIYAEPFDIVQDISVALAPTLNQATYAVGDSLVASTSLIMRGMPVSSHDASVQLFAWSTSDTSTGFGLHMRDDGRAPDATADDGIFTGGRLLGPEEIPHEGLYEVRITAGRNEPGEVPPISLSGCFGTTFTTVASGIDDPAEPGGLGFLENFPEPFVDGTTLRYEIAAAGPIQLEIYDVSGRRVRTLADRFEEPGERLAYWDARDDRGRPVPAGVYLARLTSGERVRTRLLTVLR